MKEKEFYKKVGKTKVKLMKNLLLNKVKNVESFFSDFVNLILELFNPFDLNSGMFQYIYASLTFVINMFFIMGFLATLSLSFFTIVTVIIDLPIVIGLSSKLISAILSLFLIHNKYLQKSSKIIEQEIKDYILEYDSYDKKKFNAISQCVKKFQKYNTLYGFYEFICEKLKKNKEIKQIEYYNQLLSLFKINSFEYENVKKTILEVLPESSELSVEERKKTAKAKTENIEKQENEKQQKIAEALEQLNQVLGTINQLSTEDLKRNVISTEVLEALLFEQIETHKIIKKHMTQFLPYFDLSAISFDNVDIRGICFQSTNAIINPQTVYLKSLKDCNLRGIKFSPFTTIFNDCDLRGTIIDDEFANIDLNTVSIDERTIITSKKEKNDSNQFMKKLQI